MIQCYFYVKLFKFIFVFFFFSPFHFNAISMLTVLIFFFFGTPNPIPSIDSIVIAWHMSFAKCADPPLTNEQTLGSFHGVVEGY